jgi:hypothetical protein
VVSNQDECIIDNYGMRINIGTYKGIPKDYRQ